MKRRVALLCSAFALAALAGGAGAGAAEPQSPLLALVGNGTTESVAWLDPVSLRRLPGQPKVSVGLHDIPHSFSPDGSLLALGSGRANSFVIVDVRRLRRLARVDSHFTTALTWLSDSRLLVLESEPPRLIASIVQIGKHTRVLTRYALPPEHDPIQFVGARGAAVLLLAPRNAIGGAVVAVITAGGVRTVTLSGIPAGTEPPDLSQKQPLTRYAYPGLAVDPDAGHAFVIAGGGPVAEVDLSGLAVEYHDLASSRQATAIADGGGQVVLGEGSSREAAWLGRGLLAVSGGDEWTEAGPDGRVQRFTNAGLRLIDTAAWTERTLDDRAEWFAWTGGFLVAVSSEPRRLTVFDPAGELQFRRPLQADGVQLSRDHAYLTLGNEYRSHRVRVVELESGRTLRTVRVPGWFYPLSRESPESCWC